MAMNLNEADVGSVQGRVPRGPTLEEQQEKESRHFAGVAGAQRDERQQFVNKASSPLDEAMRVVAADEAHRSLSADQILMFRSIMPAWKANMRQLSDGLFQWFRHQGFWPKGWDRWMNLHPGATVTISTQEYMLLKKAEKIALIHSEVSEMLEAVRKGDLANEAEEWADTLVRLMDYNGGFTINGEEAFEAKSYENYKRPFKHGKGF